MLYLFFTLAVPVAGQAPQLSYPWKHAKAFVHNQPYALEVVRGMRMAHGEGS